MASWTNYYPRSELCQSADGEVSSNPIEFSQADFEQLISSLHDKSFTDSKFDEANKLELVQYLMGKFAKDEIVSFQYLQTLLTMSIRHLKTQSNIVDIQFPPKGEEPNYINVCGNTHGQYDDFITIFTDSVTGFPSENNRYIFNGDIVDRGDKAIEIFVILLTLQLTSGNSQIITILRGNHETEYLTPHFGFIREISNKYLPVAQLKALFFELFHSLPFAATIDSTVFIVHGGLAINTYDLTLQEINSEVDRFVEPEEHTILYNFLWVDPERYSTRETAAKDFYDGFRGTCFGKRVTDHFLEKNKLSLLVRSHEFHDDGYAILHGGNCITIFSAPNYHHYPSKAGVLRFSLVTADEDNNNNNNISGKVDDEETDTANISNELKAEIYQFHAAKKCIWSKYSNYY
jgi:serine/threonine-protein phosphatase 5